MKNLKQASLLLLFVAFSMQVISQMAVVEYMKVKPGNAGKYLAVEKDWKKIHEARLKAGLIESWTLYENMFAGADEPYQYAVVTVYKDLAAYEKAWSDSLAMSAYPDYKEKDWDGFYTKTEDSRVMSNIDVFYSVMQADAKSTKPGKYLAISTMNVKPGGEDAYEKLEKDIYKRLHESMIKSGNMEGWGVWAKYPGSYKDYQYVTVNVYSSLAQMNSSNYADVFKKTFPALKIDDVTSKTTAARTVTENFIWKQVEDVSKN